MQKGAQPGDETVMVTEKLTYKPRIYASIKVYLWGKLAKGNLAYKLLSCKNHKAQTVSSL